MTTPVYVGTSNGASSGANGVGLSTDTKPTDLPNGTTFLEVNTKKIYVIYNGTWYEQ